MGYGWLLFAVIIVALIVGFYSLKTLTGLAEQKQNRQKERQKRIADIPRKVAKTKSVYIPHLAKTLQKSFPDNADEIDEISIDAFYDATTEWRACYAADFTAEVHRENTLDNPDFPDLLKAEIIPKLPPKMKSFAEKNFKEWFDKTNTALKISAEKTLAEGIEI